MRGRCAGDVLLLTKPLGTGILTTAFKRDLCGESELAPAVASMRMLNAGAARAAVRVGVHAATDVTGFGLLGHLHNMLMASGLGAEIRAGALPVLPGVRDLVDRGAVAGGTRRNLEARRDVDWDPRVSEADRILCADAQTSGGLLLAVAGRDAAELQRQLKVEGTLASSDRRTMCRGRAGHHSRAGELADGPSLDTRTDGPARVGGATRTPRDAGAPGHGVCRGGAPSRRLWVGRRRSWASFR